MLKNTTKVVNAVRYAVKTRKHWEAFVAENGITYDDIADTARALASLAFPDDETVQTVNGKRTRYGNAVQAAGYMLRAVIEKPEDDEPKPVVLRVSLSGEGGGSSVVEIDSPLGQEIIKFLAGQQS